MRQICHDPPFSFFCLVTAQRPRWSVYSVHLPLLPHEIRIVLRIEVLLPIFRHYPGVSGDLAIFQKAVVVCTVKNLAIDAPIPFIGNTLVVFFARRAGVPSDRGGSLRSRHDVGVYTSRLTFRIQQTGSAAAADSGPLERGVRSISAHGAQDRSKLRRRHQLPRTEQELVGQSRARRTR